MKWACRFQLQSTGGLRTTDRDKSSTKRPKTNGKEKVEGYEESRIGRGYINVGDRKKFSKIAGKLIRLFALMIGPVWFGFAVNVENFKANNFCNNEITTRKKRYYQHNHTKKTALSALFDNEFCFCCFCSTVFVT